MTLRAPPRAAAITSWVLAVACVLAPGTRARAQAAPADSASAEQGAAALLALAEQAMTELDYKQSRALAQTALERGKLDQPGLIRAYRLIAVASAQLGDEAAAESAFVRLFALEPDSTIATRLAPERRSAVLNARGFWSVRREAFGLAVSYQRRERRIELQLTDPLEWGAVVHVWYRFGARDYLKQARAAAPHMLFEVGEIGLSDPLELYAFVVDAHGNTLLTFGHERDPRSFGLSDSELADFLRRDIRGGQSGSYALRLEELGVEVGVHGYLSLEFKPVAGTPSFDLHHATVMIRASLQPAVSLELALEWEHLAREAGDFYLPHAFMDLKATDALILRAGWFEVPVGAFNEYLYPDFVRITGLPPDFTRTIVPGLWSEVGLQLRGHFPIGALTHFTYAVFVVNGLEQPDPDPSDGEVAEGGEIADMRFHARDRFSGDKAFGGRLGLEVGEFDFGLSGYTGRYTIEADRQLRIGDIDISYRGALLTVRAEAALALQEIRRETLRKFGMYALVALRPLPALEPYAEFDFTDLDVITRRVVVGLAVYPFPTRRTTRNLRLKSEIGLNVPADKLELVWFFQLTTGF